MKTLSGEENVGHVVQAFDGSVCGRVEENGGASLQVGDAEAAWEQKRLAQQHHAREEQVRRQYEKKQRMQAFAAKRREELRTERAAMRAAGLVRDVTNKPCPVVSWDSFCTCQQTEVDGWCVACPAA